MSKLGNVALLALSIFLLAGCTANASTTTGGRPTSAASTLKLGFLANVTHAPALIGLKQGFITKNLGPTKISTEIFDAGPAAIEALSSGAIDAAYIGPSPAINSYIKSAHASLRVVSGATYGGAQLVVRPGIISPHQLTGARLATPQLGNTQDVALRWWLKGQGLSSKLSGGGDVAVTPTENAQTLMLFKSKKLDGAWVAEPWASRLVLEAGAHVLVNEADLWVGGKFPTTQLVVSLSYFRAHPAAVSGLVAANLEAVNWLNANPSNAASAINTALAEYAGKALPAEVLDRALKFVHFSVDPLAHTATTLLDRAVAVGVGTRGSLKNLYDLDALNAILRATGAESLPSGRSKRQ